MTMVIRSIFLQIFYLLRFIFVTTFPETIEIKVNYEKQFLKVLYLLASFESCGHAKLLILGKQETHQVTFVLRFYCLNDESVYKCKQTMIIQQDS